MGTFAEELANFKTAYNDIQTESMNTNSVFDKALTKIAEQFTSMGISSSEQAKLIATVAGQMATNISTTAQQSALALLQIPNDISIKDAQKLDIESQTSVRNAQSTQDLLNKQAQKSLIDNQSETELKKALDVVSQTSVRDAQSTQDILNKQAQKLMIDAQKSLVDSQKTSEDKRNSLNGLIDKQILDTVEGIAVKTAQASEINAKKLMTDRQTTAFSDKLKVEVMKTFAGIASMEATNSGTTTDTLTSLNAKITAVEASAT